MPECELVCNAAGCKGEDRTMEGGIQRRAAAQQSGVPNTRRVRGAAGPFAVSIVSKAGAQAVKAEMHSLSLGLDRLPRRPCGSNMTAKGQNEGKRPVNTVYRRE